MGLFEAIAGLFLLAICLAAGVLIESFITHGGVKHVGNHTEGERDNRH
jgi:hypothetical protein